jgi:hypothetical protein
MRRNQGSVFWIGGGCGAGKSSVAHAISRRFDLQLYAADAHGYAHLSRLTGSERPASSHDERRLEPSAEELAEGFLRASAEKFPLVRFRRVSGPTRRPNSRASLAPASPPKENAIHCRAPLWRSVPRAKGRTTSSRRSANILRSQAGSSQKNLRTRTRRRTGAPLQGRSASVRV